MELIEHIESMKDEPLESDETTYEKLLLQMFTIDENLPVKTEIQNPLEFARYHFTADIIEQENEVLKEEADLMRGLGKLLMIFEISGGRKGRKEGFGAIDSFNLGKMLKKFSYKEETEEFKKITKKRKD